MRVNTQRPSGLGSSPSVVETTLSTTRVALVPETLAALRAAGVAVVSVDRFAARDPERAVPGTDKCVRNVPR